MSEIAPKVVVNSEVEAQPEVYTNDFQKLDSESESGENETVNGKNEPKNGETENVVEEETTGSSEKPPKKVHPKNIQLRLLTHKRAGLGSLLQGQRVQELREMCDVKISVLDVAGDKHEKLIQVSGQQKAGLTNCVQMIAQHVSDDDKEKPEKERAIKIRGKGQLKKDEKFNVESAQICLIVPVAHIPKIIGAQGSKLPEYFESTGCRVFVFNQYPSGICLPGSNEKVISITGDPECIGLCVDEMVDIISKIKTPKKGVKFYSSKNGSTGFWDQKGHFNGWVQGNNASQNVVVNQAGMRGGMKGANRGNRGGGKMMGGTRGRGGVAWRGHVGSPYLNNFYNGQMGGGQMGGQLMGGQLMGGQMMGGQMMGGQMNNQMMGNPMMMNMQQQYAMQQQYMMQQQFMMQQQQNQGKNQQGNRGRGNSRGRGGRGGRGRGNSKSKPTAKKNDTPAAKTE